MIPVPTMTDPFGGQLIPTTLKANILWRQRIGRECGTSASRRSLIRNNCQRSPIFWLSFAGWTFHQKWVDDDGEEHPVIGKNAHVPFIPWPIQVKAIQLLYDCIAKGSDALIRKSRDMGASWLVVGLFHWFWQYRENCTFTHISASESKVDLRGNMDTLFEKHRYLYRMQPEWLRPRDVRDNYLSLQNNDNGCVIMGESTTSRAGKGGRKIAIHCDEFAEFGEKGEAVDRGTADTCACRIFNSTPKGPSTHFRRVRVDFETGKRKGKIVVLHWHDHPQKGRGAVLEFDPVAKKEKWTSPYYKIQGERRGEKDVAENLDMDDDTSENLFFSVAELDMHRNKHCRPPMLIGNLHFPEIPEMDVKRDILRRKEVSRVKFESNDRQKPWRFWMPLVHDRTTNTDRPSQQARYIFGCDPSRGAGASNSVCTVMEAGTGVIVAKYWDAYTLPERFAEIIAFAAMWFGGQGWPLIVPERNGPGGDLCKRLMMLGYANPFFMFVEDERTRKKTRKVGFWSSTKSKSMLLGHYRSAIKDNSIINPCEEGLEEAKGYVCVDDKIMSATVDEGEEGGYELHGDHVIADALALWGRGESGKSGGKEIILPGSVAYRRQQRKVGDRKRMESRDDGDW
jgi:hypothetical protein